MTPEERQRHLQYMSNVLLRYLAEGDGPSVDAIKASITALEREGKMEERLRWTFERGYGLRTDEEFAAYCRKLDKQMRGDKEALDD